MANPTDADTTFFRKAKSPALFLLAPEDHARRCSVHGALILGTAKARGVPGKMPCCIDHGLVPMDTVIILTDLCLSTWGGVVKAAGNVSLFQDAAAQDFWSLVAQVDAIGPDRLATWKGAETVARYRAVAAWWAIHRPDWGGQGELQVASSVLALVNVLTLVLGDEEGLRAQALRCAGPGAVDGKLRELRQDRMELMRKGREASGTGTEDAFYIEEEKGEKKTASAAAGSSTGLFRRKQ